MKPPGAQGSQSTYTDLLSVIEEMGKEIRPTYAGSKSAMERLKRGRGGGVGWQARGTGRPPVLRARGSPRGGRKGGVGLTWGVPSASPRRHHPRPGAGQGVPGGDRAQRPHVTAAVTRGPPGVPAPLAAGGWGGGGAPCYPRRPPALSALFINACFYK